MPRLPGATLTDPPETLGPVLDFMRLLWAVDHGLLKMSRRMERTLGVTGPQRLVVRIVGRHPGISAGALARTLHLHPGTLTGVLRRLTQKALLERIADPRDGRRAMFQLTSGGSAIDQRRTGTSEDRVRGALRSVTPAEIATVTRVLTAIARHLRRS